MRKSLVLITLFALPAFAQQKMQAPNLIALAKSGEPGLSAAIAGNFDAKALPTRPCMTCANL